ncbi:MAG: helix-turn-helix transcriptional regulator [Phycisphaerales bacterium]|nr:helix-turn-helix transcriptional regulator [Phycisphaerales bacterium]
MPESDAERQAPVRTHARIQAGPFRISHKSYSEAFAQDWHEHEEAAIDFVLDGEGEGTYAGRCVASRAGAVEYFAPGIRHRFRSGPRGIRTLHVVIPSSQVRESGICAQVLVRALDGSSVSSLAVALLCELSAAGEPDTLLLESLAMRMLEEVGGAALEPPDEGAWIAQVRELLLSEPERAKSLGAIAEHVGRHPSHVARHFQRSVGVSVGEFGRRVRLARAARAMAASPPRSIAAIALDLGYADQAHFTRSFRAAHGCTPAEFRRVLSAGGVG